MKALTVFDILNKLYDSLTDLVPNFLGALVIIIVGIILAKFISKLLSKFLQKIKIDRLSDMINDLDLLESSSFEFKLSSFLSKLVYYILLLIFWLAAAEVLGIDAVTELLNNIIEYLPNLLTAFIILIIGVLVSDAVKNLVQSALDSLGVPSAKLIAGFIFYFLLINIALSALSQAKINTDFIAQNLSIIIGGVVLSFAIGYGLASKEIASNMLSSFYYKDQYRVGTVIEIDGYRGKILSLEKSTIILGTDEGEVIIPMSHLSKNAVKVIK